jgi:hypothetical protein
MDVTLPEEIVDGIVVTGLKDQLGYIQGDIERLTKQKKKKDFENQELGTLISLQGAFQEVIQYYGG